MTQVAGKPSSKSAATAAPAATTKTQKKSNEANADKPPADEDEETKKRRARAERFGLPFVENPAALHNKKAGKPAAAKSTTAGAASNGTGRNKGAPKATRTIEEV